MIANSYWESKQLSREVIDLHQVSEKKSNDFNQEMERQRKAFDEKMKAWKDEKKALRDDMKAQRKAWKEEMAAVLSLHTHTLRLGEIRSQAMLRKTMRGYRAEINELKDQVVTLTSDDAILRSKNEVLEEKVMTLTSRNAILEEQVVTLTAKNVVLEKQVVTLTAKNVALEEQVASLPAKNVVLEEQVAALTTTVDRYAAVDNNLQHLSEHLDEVNGSCNPRRFNRM